MTESPLEAGHPEELRQVLCRRIALLTAVGLLLLALIVVSVVLGLILNAADDWTGVSAIRAVVGVLAVLSVLILAGLLASLSRAVLILLESREDESIEGADSRSNPEADATDAG